MPRTVEPAQESLADVLAHATFETVAVLTKLAADNDLSLTQLRLLAILRDRRARMSALAAHLGLDRSSMTGLVARAEKRGLLARSGAGDDGRAVEVHLTPAGLRLAAGLQRATSTALSTLTDRLSATDQHRLRALLERLVDPAGS